ncbi:type IV pilin [Halorhabdus rudnickae]|uniref:type IV pilin n=1 Tax=Halorhabdus rudnickae TaxID=1775544 RepID=UPI001FCED46A|nr:type IV pilin [Halorhabdus rudnickae]
MSSWSRADSPVIANILLVAIVVILAATLSVLVLGFTDEANQPGPIVGQSTGTLEPNPPGSGSDNGFVRIRHMAGDTIRMSDTEVVVDATAACGKRSRIVDLPIEDSRLSNSNYEGADIFDNSFAGLPDGSALERQKYASGDVISFRIPQTDCIITGRETITVRVIHTPTNSVVITKTLTAT